ncbi:PREDICTED: uncharacterized protein LOC105501749 isoform X2 [Colobus angolensis palliatus]|uniref:uncharacterized protein LOC105501749 isoform X2 n=1 Tax=Colobus angolensis palliatus TaxID=336983 RepID=UPI0005F38B58|nr:PREDICTED: uncharacterized protein LOC105501749 isoform X2 [Colobus angolensis palliatus]
MPFQFHGTEKITFFRQMDTCVLRKRPSSQQYLCQQSYANKTFPEEPRDLGATHSGNCSLWVLPAEHRPAVSARKSQKPPGEGEEEGGGDALRAVRHGTGSSRRAPRRAPSWGTGLPYPRGRACGARASRPGPRTNQIEAKKLPAFKILLLLRHHSPRCGEQVVLEAREAGSARELTDKPAGHLDRWTRRWRPRPDPDPKSVPAPPGGGAYSVTPTRRRRLFTSADLQGSPPA